MDLSGSRVDHRGVDTRHDYYRRIGAKGLAPLWEVLGALVPREPSTRAAPAHWRYAQIRDDVLEAGQVISAQEAERRVLILENPALPGQACATGTLYAGLQLILPGEIAPPHRHTQSALRLVLDGEGAYTAVNGERTTMHRGDFIVTPRWTWHEHGNNGVEPVVWLDGLDIPLIRFFDAGFAEKDPAEPIDPPPPEGDALMRYGSNMAPIDVEATSADPTRLFTYPYERTRAALLAVANGVPDPHHGHKLRYLNPLTGGAPMNTIGAYAQRLPAGFASRPSRSTDGTVYVCLEGEGELIVGEQAFDFHESDVLVVPSWHTLRLRALADTILFSFSDRPAQQALGLWREQKL
jgi:gentisate 1,2-dioxygenase